MATTTGAKTSTNPHPTKVTKVFGNRNTANDRVGNDEPIPPNTIHEGTATDYLDQNNTRAFDMQPNAAKSESSLKNNIKAGAKTTIFIPEKDATRIDCPLISAYDAASPALITQNNVNPAVTKPDPGQ